MNKIIFNCQTITPMICCGYDGKTPEFRPPSLKGALRFWWRAFNGHLSLEELKKREQFIFGGTDDSIGKSKIEIKIIHKPLKFNKVITLPHRERAFPSDSIPKDNNFDIIARFGDRLECDYIPDAALFVESLFKLVSTLGGIGKRSRRGFGGFEIKSVNNQISKSQISDEILLSHINAVNNSSIYHLTESPRHGISLTANSINSNKNYPYVKMIEIGQKTSRNCDDLIKTISFSSHDNNSDYTGFATRGRFASPVYVTVCRSGNDFVPVITTLNAYHEKGISGINKSEKFKTDILN